MEHFFHFNNLFYKYKSGFLPDHSTVYELIETYMYHYIVKSVDEKKSCCVVFCDLSMAFDRVWNKDILFALETYGITANILNGSKVIYVNNTLLLQL